MEQKLLNVKEVAKQLDCSNTYIYQLYREGKLKGIRLGFGYLRFSQEEVDRILNMWKDSNYEPKTYEK